MRNAKKVHDGCAAGSRRNCRGFSLGRNANAQAQPTDPILDNARNDAGPGQKIFRFDTLATKPLGRYPLKLHQAVAGARQEVWGRCKPRRRH
jgi:hypothetical protein